MEFSADGGRTWPETRLGERRPAKHGEAWSYTWDAGEPGDYELCARATTLPARPSRSMSPIPGIQARSAVNAVQRVRVRVT